MICKKPKPALKSLLMQHPPKKILYLGLDPSRYEHTGELVHLPFIQGIPYPFSGKVQEAFESLESYTHVVLTSRMGAKLYSDYAEFALQNVQNKIYISVGSATTELLEQRGIKVDYTATVQTGEGVVEVLKGLDLQKAHLFFPCSSLARDVIPNYCAKQQIRMTTLDLYDTQPSDIPLPDLAEFDQIVFTSPSVVHAFFARTVTHPKRDICCPIGPVTADALNVYYISNST